MLPPNRFLYLDKRRIVHVQSIEDARWHYRTYLELRGWNKKRRKYVEGALYTDPFISNCRIIDLGKGEKLDLDIQTEFNIQSTISISLEPDKNHPHLCHCVKLAKIVSRYQPNTFRKNCHDKGEMFVVGTGRLGSSRVGTYQLTDYPGVAEALSDLKYADQYYCNIGLSETVDKIRKLKKYDNHPSMDNCFVSSITSSSNYINAAHVDVDDCCEGIITWTIDEDDPDNEFYFVLPNVTLDGPKATIIKIHHGLTIKIDARIIMHCSSLLFKRKRTNVYGTYFGVKT